MLKGTTQAVDPNDLPEGVTNKDIEKINRGALSVRKRNQQSVYVLKGTTQKVDPNALPEGVTSECIEKINKGALSDRKRKQQPVYVIKGTAQAVDPNNLPGGVTSEGIEKIKKGALSVRKHQQSMYVITNTTQKVDPNNLSEGMTSEGMKAKTRNFSKRKKKSNNNNIKKRQRKQTNTTNIVHDKDAALINTSDSSHEAVVIKQEPCELNTTFSLPPLSLSELQEVAKILRGNSVAENNCSKYTMAFMEYFSTRIKPHEPVSSNPSTANDFCVYVKTEGNHISSSKIIREHTFFPCNQVPMENAEGLIDIDNLQWAEEIDYFSQIPCDLQCLEQTLKEYAMIHEKQEAYGIINFAHPVQAGIAGHSINYYATPTTVHLIDCQLIHKGEGEAVFPIQDLKKYYCFEGNGSHQKNSPLKIFQHLVFIAPHVNTIHHQKIDTSIESSHLFNHFSNTMSDTQITTALGIFGEQNKKKASTPHNVIEPLVWRKDKKRSYF